MEIQAESLTLIGVNSQASEGGSHPGMYSSLGQSAEMTQNDHDNWMEKYGDEEKWLSEDFESEDDGPDKCQSMQEEMRKMTAEKGSKAVKESRSEKSVKPVSPKADNGSEEEWVDVVPDRTK